MTTTKTAMQRYSSNIDQCRKDVETQYVRCWGWSPAEGTFDRIMLNYGYGDYWIAAALAHPDSGCKNVSCRQLTGREIEEKAQEIYSQKKANDAHLDVVARSDLARRVNWPLPGSPEMGIGRVIWEYHMPGRIHTVDGADGQSPRWVRQMAAAHWPEANGIQVVRVRVFCETNHRFESAEGVHSVLLDLSPDKIGIDCTDVGGSNCWES